jgi:hypothetical protein
MTTRTRSTYQNPRYLQLWLVFDWPEPTDRVPVGCGECGWRSRRHRRAASGRPCPSCGGLVRLLPDPWEPADRQRAQQDNVLSLRERKADVPAARERSAPRMVTGRQVWSR